MCIRDSVRGVSEALQDVNAFGFAIDAGVQYVTGAEDNFRLGISLRNVGSPMSFGGQGLAFPATTDQGSTIVLDQRSQRFEIPSVLNIGVSYDFYLLQNRVTPLGETASDDTELNVKNRELILRVLGNFTSNAFSRDQVGGGVELIFNEIFTLRAAYREEIGSTGFIKENIYTGLAFGGTAEIPFNEAGSSKLGIDYAYRTTDPFRGTHNFTLRLMF